MQNLSERQRETLDFIRKYVTEHGVAPSRPEIAEALGLTHKSTVDAHLSALMKKGWIELRPGSPRNIRLLREQLPVIVAGQIAAGEAILTESRVTRQVPRAVAEMFSPAPSYFLEVQGTSMNKLGLTTGTIVAIRRGDTPRNRDVVVARIDDAVTLKRFIRKDAQHIELRPESTDTEHQVIEVDLTKDEFHVDGVAVGALIGQGFNPIGGYEETDTSNGEDRPAGDLRSTARRAPRHAARNAERGKQACRDGQESP